MEPTKQTYRLGVDIGGTFTDIVLLGEGGTILTKKVLSTPDDYARAVVAGAVELLDETGIAREQVTGIVHASTVASNTILEGRGARTALITTRGFRDVLEMRRLRIPILYDIQYEKPEPLVPRQLRYEVDERTGPRGETWEPLDEGSVAVVAERIADTKVEALAICLLHSYADDAHERRVEALLRERVGADVYVTRSSDILPEIREYERTSTAVVNAYVGPVVSRYIAKLEQDLQSAGLTAPLEIMQSSGGTLTPDAAHRKPAHLVECGPAAGVMACSYLGRLTGRGNLISLDMGGTTAKAALLEDGEPIRTSEYEVGAGINLSSKLVKGGGYAIKLPFIDVSEIGAGGGSIVRVDDLGRVTVGPVSAGAAPGPVCYDLGGEEPTLTDALLTLGYLNGSSLVGGAVALNAAKARAAVADVAERLNRPLDEAAYGIFLLAVSTMTRAVKAVTTYRGRDPRDFAVCAFGGNGPVTGVQIARELEIETVLIPPSSGVFSALGLLFADSEHEFVRTLMLRGQDVTSAVLEQTFSALEDTASAAVAGDVASDTTITITRYAEVRYAGQAYELAVRVPEGSVDVDRLKTAFVEEHVRTYGHGSITDPIDVVAVRVVARIGRVGGQNYDPLASIADGGRATSSRSAYFGPDIGRIDVPVIARAALIDGARRGPFLIDEYDSTVVVPPAATAQLDPYGNIEVRLSVH